MVTPSMVMVLLMVLVFVGEEEVRGEWGVHNVPCQACMRGNNKYLAGRHGEARNDARVSAQSRRPTSHHPTAQRMAELRTIHERSARR